MEFNLDMLYTNGNTAEPRKRGMGDAAVDLKGTTINEAKPETFAKVLD